MTTREINERIAAALERVANGRGADLRLQLHAVAAELRAAEPARVWECPSCDFACAGKIGIFGGHTDCHGKMDHSRVGCVVVPKLATPPPWPKASKCDHCRSRGAITCPQHGIGAAPSPSLIERFKAWHMGRHDDCLHCDVSDALEAAQADTRRLDALDRWALDTPREHVGTVRLQIAWPESDNLRATADALAATMERKP